MARLKQRAKRNRFHGNRFGRDIISNNSRTGRTISTSAIDASVNLITVKRHILRQLELLQYTFCMNYLF